MQRPAPSTTHSSGASTRCTGISVSGSMRQVEAAQHARRRRRGGCPDDEVLGQLGRRLGQAAHHRVDDGRHELVDRLPHLLGREDDGLGQAAHEVAAAHLGL